MTSPHRASDTPFAVDVKQGEDYWWCSCGVSKAQPFCDGSHKAAGEFSPVKFTAEVDSKVYFCGCKATRNQPLCDGSHKNAL
jgi:CDGSH-type Zn-finger protein